MKRRDFLKRVLAAATAASAGGCLTVETAGAGRRAATRGVVVSARDLSGAFDWPRLAHEAGLTTIATHIGPRDVMPFMLSGRGARFLDACARYGLQVEHELHAIDWLLPRTMFATDPAFFRMNEKGARTPDSNCCPSNPFALEVIACRAVEVAREESFENEPALVADSPVSLEIFKPNFWKFSGDYNLQFMQSHFSRNWYKSGDDNLSAVANVILRYNYNNQQKIKWDNMLEMKVGIQNSPSDTIHKLKTTSDLLRYTGKLGLQATKKWYYTFQILATSQFVRGYKSNDPLIASENLVTPRAVLFTYNGSVKTSSNTGNTSGGGSGNN